MRRRTAGPRVAELMPAAIPVDATDDPRLADYALLADERALAARGLFVAEGRLVVQRLLEGGRHELRSVLVNAAALEALTPLLGALEAPVYVCAPRFFERLTGHHFHRGCLALAVRPASRAPLALAHEVRSLCVLERVADPDNVGSVFRSARAFGVGALWLGPGSADPLSRKTIRTSVGAALDVPFARLRSEVGSEPEAWDFGRCLVGLRQQGYEILALTPREPAVDIRTLQLAPACRLALLIGTEGEGLGAEALELATRRVRIAMRPDVDSLNLGVAAGIALHALMRS
jgi:tRNA G18 (ribose-2'-O)-methylase SpoU